jgi:hypothetical protein
MSHLDQVAVIRNHIKQHQYSEAIRVGRGELARDCDSAELLVLMATAILLSDGNSGSLEEARQWLERATSGDPRSVDASLELAHLLDAVADEQELAAQGFESAGMQALGYLEDALAGLASTGSAAVELRRRIAEVLKDAVEADASGSNP